MARGIVDPVTGEVTITAGAGKFVPSVSYYQSGTTRNSEEITPNGYSSQTVTLPNAMPDADYVVVLSADGGYWHTTIIHTAVTSKTASSFKIFLGNPSASVSVPASALQIKWQAFKLMTDESRALDEQAIATNTADIATLKSSVNDTAVYTLPTSAYNSDVVTPDSTAASTTIQSYGKIRIIEGGGVPFKTVGNKNNVTVLTLPSGYRPKYKAELMAMCTSGTAGTGVLRCWLDTSGIVHVWTGDMQCGGYLFISGTYIAAD